jgi:hypothetical protein
MASSAETKNTGFNSDIPSSSRNNFGTNQDRQHSKSDRNAGRLSGTWGGGEEEEEERFDEEVDSEQFNDSGEPKHKSSY